MKIHIISFCQLVSNGATPPAQADPLAWLTEDELNTLWGRWLNEKLEAGDVDLDEKYGFWTDIGIIPPERGDLLPEEE